MATLLGRNPSDRKDRIGNSSYFVMNWAWNPCTTLNNRLSTVFTLQMQNPEALPILTSEFLLNQHLNKQILRIQTLLHTSDTLTWFKKNVPFLLYSSFCVYPLFLHSWNVISLLFNILFHLNWRRPKYLSNHKLLHKCNSTKEFKSTDTHSYS